VPEIIARRESLTSQLQTLEREQGAALLDDKPFDMAPVNAVRDELDALDHAEAEASRRDRAADADAHAQATAQATKELETRLVDYLGAIKAAQGHATGLADQMVRIEGLRGDMEILTRRLGGSVPDILNANGSRTILSRLIASQFNRFGVGSEFGIIDWMSTPPVADWQAAIVKKFGVNLETKETQ